MRSRTSALLGRAPQFPRDLGATVSTEVRGLAVLASPALNKGTAFTAAERISLGLTGLVPPELNDLAGQVKRAYVHYERLPDAIRKRIYLAAIRDRNQVLFYRLFSEHLREMIPIVDDLALGVAAGLGCQECRLPRGIYLSIDHPEAIAEAFANLRLAADDVDLLIATDAGQSPGTGDWGVTGSDALTGKLSIHTAAGGIDPARAIPVMLDVGVDRQSVLDDPTYSGNRHPRTGGARYDAFIDAYVEAATSAFPDAILQWQDFAPANWREILNRYGQRNRMFNEDMQGAGAITLAAAISAVRICGTPFRNQRVIIFGAGPAGIGIADQIRDAMIAEGLSKEGATSQFWCIDRRGLITSDTLDPTQAHQAPYARNAGESRSWNRNGGVIDLAEVARRVRPTMLIGASASPGAFTEAIVRGMAAHTDRPIIFPLSTPAIHAEAASADLIAWTEGRALIASGSPSAPITHRGVTYVTAQVVNAMLCPGLVLGAIACRASRISDGMFAAAAAAVSSLVAVRQPGPSLLPHLDDLRSVSAAVAMAVAEAAEGEGLARVELPDLEQNVQDVMWQPVYPRIEAS